MVTYFNFLTQEIENIKEAKDFYLILCSKNQYKLTASPLIVDNAERDFLTNADKFWFVTRRQFEENITTLCPDNKTICTMLTQQEVEQLFGFDPTKIEPYQFNKVPSEIQSKNISELIAYLSINNARTLETRYATRCLMETAFDPSTASIIVASEGLSQLISLLYLTDDMPTKQYVIIAIAMLDNSAENQKIISEMNGIALLLLNVQTISEIVTRRCAVAGLANLLQHSPDIINEVQDIALFISLLNSTDDILTKLYATMVLVNLTGNIVSNRNIIRVNNGIAPLIALLNSNDIRIVWAAIAVLSNVALNDENLYSIHENNGIISIIRLMGSNNLLIMRCATQAIMNLSRNVEIKDVIRELGGINVLTSLLVSVDDILTKQFAVVALLSLSYKNSANQDLIREISVIQSLVLLLDSTNDLVTKQSIARILLHLIQHTETKDIIGRIHGVASLILSLNSTSNVSLKRDLTLLICCLADTDNKVLMDLLSDSNVITALIILLDSSGDILTKRHALGALINISAIKSNKHVIRECDGIRLLILSLQHSDDTLIIRYVTQILANLSGGGADHEENTDIIRELGGINLLILLLNSTHDILIMRGVAESLLNLSANDKNKDIIYECGGVVSLVSLLNSTDDVLTKRFAIATILNLTAKFANHNVIRESGGIASLVSMSRICRNDLLSQQYVSMALLNLTANVANHNSIINANGIAMLSDLANDSEDELTKNHSRMALIRLGVVFAEPAVNSSTLPLQLPGASHQNNESSNGALSESTVSAHFYLRAIQVLLLIGGLFAIVVILTCPLMANILGITNILGLSPYTVMLGASFLSTSALITASVFAFFDRRNHTEPERLAPISDFSLRSGLT